MDYWTTIGYCYKHSRSIEHRLANKKERQEVDLTEGWVHGHLNLGVRGFCEEVEGCTDTYPQVWRWVKALEA